MREKKRKICHKSSVCNSTYTKNISQKLNITKTVSIHSETNYTPELFVHWDGLTVRYTSLAVKNINKIFLPPTPSK